jgi:hypothetical protein
MTDETFNKIVSERVKKIQTVLSAKSKQYALDGDRLHNFKVAARLLKTTPEQALWGIAVKHLVSVEDLVMGRLAPTQETVDEKIGDMINYLVLLEAVLTETDREEMR